MQRNINIISQVKTLTIERGKQILYLILKKKSFSKEIIEELEKEIEERMNIFINSIAPKLQNINFENQEQSLKVIILRGLINILKKMIEEHKLELSESDKKVLDDIMKNEEENIEKENNNKISEDNGKNDDDGKNSKGKNDDGKKDNHHNNEKSNQNDMEPNKKNNYCPTQ